MKGNLLDDLGLGDSGHPAEQNDSAFTNLLDYAIVMWGPLAEDDDPKIRLAAVKEMFALLKACARDPGAIGKTRDEISSLISDKVAARLKNGLETMSESGTITG